MQFVIAFLILISFAFTVMEAEMTPSEGSQIYILLHQLDLCFTTIFGSRSSPPKAPSFPLNPSRL